jgi:hypothetical protein
MATYSKRIKINPNVLLEYTFDNSNFRSEDYKVLTNLKEQTKSYLSDSTINNEENSFFLVDSILSKYSPIDISNFNFLREQNYFTSPVVYDKLRIYFPNGFDFLNSGYLGFYINVYTLGYDNNKKYSLSNFFYNINNTSSINLFDLPSPFYFDEKFWVRAIELQFPSISNVSDNRIISGNINVPASNSINENLTYGEGLSTNAPIFIDFAYISSTQTVMNIPYYFTGDLYSTSLPQTPEFTELGINISESTQGDYFEIYGTYLGSNENMDEFAYKQEISGVLVQLQYIVTLYEENILTSTQTYQVTENFTQKLLYRPVIQFSNTTAAIDVELRIVNLRDNSYVSKFGSLGITNSLNKYGLRLTRLNMDSGVVNAEIFNLKVKNTMNGGASLDSFVDIMKVPYPVMVDRYRILTKTNSSSTNTNGYIPNGLLEILITSFDNVIEFNIAKDVNQDGTPEPYDLSTVSVNSNLKLVFKSDSEKLEKDPFFEADNNYQLGNISYKIQEKDYKLLRRIYDKGYDNFYLVVNANGINTQLYSGKFLFYEDVTFIKETIPTTITTTGPTTTGARTTTTGARVTTTGARVTTNTVTGPLVKKTTTGATGTIKSTTGSSKTGAPSTTGSASTQIDRNVKNNNPFVKNNMTEYKEDGSVDKNYINLMIYVRYQINIDKMDTYLKSIGIIPEIKYGNVYYLKRVYATTVVDIKSQIFIEKVFELPLTTGQVPKPQPNINSDKNLNVYKNPPVKSTKSPTKPFTPPKSEIFLDKASEDNITKGKSKNIRKLE